MSIHITLLICWGLEQVPSECIHTVWNWTFWLRRGRRLYSPMAIDQQTGENDDDEDKDAKYDSFSRTRGRPNIIIVKSSLRTLFAARFFVLKKFVAHWMVWVLFLVLPEGNLFQ